MDIKVTEIDWAVMEKALTQAKEGRLHILDCMDKDTASSLSGLSAREELHEFAPRMETLLVKPDRIRDIIGPGGKVIRAIQETTGAKIDVEDSGQVTVFGLDGASVAQAMAMVDELTQEAEIGRKPSARGRTASSAGSRSWRRRTIRLRCSSISARSTSITEASA